MFKETDMAIQKLVDERKCKGCGSWFRLANLTDGNCVNCANLPENAGPREKFIYQDVKRSDIEKKLSLCLDKLNKILTLMGSTDDKPKGYTKNCKRCGEVFIGETPATRYCPACKDKNDGDK
jgi:DNA-directed RNA polymerase subunit M/transcription elongation factor TFIIS